MNPYTSKTDQHFVSPYATLIKQASLCVPNPYINLVNFNCNTDILKIMVTMTN